MMHKLHKKSRLVLLQSMMTEYYLYYIILYYIVLYCIILYYIILYYIILYYIIFLTGAPK